MCWCKMPAGNCSSYKMKAMKFTRQYTGLLLLALLAFFGCTRKNYELGGLPDPSEIDFEVVQDLSVDPGGNTVYLINRTDKIIPIWDYGTGRSNRNMDTVRFAFQGDYVIKFSAETAGGLVELPPVTIKVTKDNLNYVNDPLWTALTGGVGNEKTWLLDLDANGVSKHFDGPLYFYGTDNIWEGACKAGGSDCWNWNPGWKDNTWLMPSGNYGSMTFSLKGGPFVKVEHKMVPSRGSENGTYFLDVNAKTLSMTDAAPLHDDGRDKCVGQWGNIRLLSLNENFMQLAVMRSACESPCLLVYNFISKEFNDNWVPPPPAIKQPDEGYNPTFDPGELLAMLTGTSTGRFWVLDGTGNPIDWVGKGNGWTTDKNSSYNWGWNESWDDAIKNAWIKFDNVGGQHYTRFQNGVLTTGNFTIDEAKNEINLQGNTLLQNASSWMNPTTSVLKVVKGFPDNYQSKGIWFGTSYDAGKDEWFVWHYVMP